MRGSCDEGMNGESSSGLLSLVEIVLTHLGTDSQYLL